MERGSGPVTVVFESGLGFSRSCWGFVVPEVAEHARTVVYDRSGLGRSEARGFPRTLPRIAADLSDLLDTLGPGPFVLVGHSWGGPIVRSAAALDRSRIRGLVLVDQTDENCVTYFTPATRRQFAFAERVTPLLARTGLYALMMGRIGKDQPADVVRDFVAEDATLTAARTSSSEIHDVIPSLERLRATPLDLGDLPVTLISGTRLPRRGRRNREELITGHRTTAASLPGGRWVEAPASDHLVMLTEPQVVVDEVLRLL